MIELRELQLYQLEILKELARVCDENDIVYYIAYGTLLGAVRHQGFIPWDDDIDVCMDYENYVKFEQIAPKALKERYYFSNRRTNPKNYTYWSRIGVKNSTSIDKSLSKIHADWGICIDIFPIFDVPEDENQRAEFASDVKEFMKYSTKYLHMYTIKGAKGILKLKKMVHWIMPDWMNLKKFYSLEEKLGQVKSEKHCAIIDGGTYILQDKKNFARVTKLTFEGVELSAPAGYHEILTADYGDYMVPQKYVMHSADENVVIKLDEPYQNYWT